MVLFLTFNFILFCGVEGVVWGVGGWLFALKSCIRLFQGKIPYIASLDYDMNERKESMKFYIEKIALDYVRINITPFMNAEFKYDGKIKPNIGGSGGGP